MKVDRIDRPNQVIAKQRYQHKSHGQMVAQSPLHQMTNLVHGEVIGKEEGQGHEEDAEMAHNIMDSWRMGSEPIKSRNLSRVV